jgi:hypothetical protein
MLIGVRIANLLIMYAKCIVVDKFDGTASVRETSSHSLSGNFKVYIFRYSWRVPEPYIEETCGAILVGG